MPTPLKLMPAGVTLFLATLSALSAYPLDAYPQTGIRRLLAYQKIQQGLIPGHFKLPPGALLSATQIHLRLLGMNPGYDITAETPRDEGLQRGLSGMFRNRDPSYSIALLDITDPVRPRYAALQPSRSYIPGSVGKLLVMTALFAQLRRLFPNDVPARVRLLKSTHIRADSFVLTDHHMVPVVSEDLDRVRHRRIVIGDTFTLWEWVDHMASPSSNAAASTVWKQVLLMDAFGAGYPPSEAREQAFFRDTPPPKLGRRAVALIEEPLARAGLDTSRLRQGTFFTRTASRMIPGERSYATPKQLLRWTLRLEQGRLVDAWSSLEMKKLLYFTRRRYRYAASPALNHSAVFFKSGSLYKCRAEPGYHCGQYRGNVTNLMHSVAIVESPAGGSASRIYLIALMSNVLKKNSAWEHLRIAAEIEKLIQSQPPARRPQQQQATPYRRAAIEVMTGLPLAPLCRPSGPVGEGHERSH
ncbi:MAG: hypothetical protein ACE5JX_09140 [Acidobacteriota bacterium]